MKSPRTRRGLLPLGFFDLRVSHLLKLRQRLLLLLKTLVGFQVFNGRQIFGTHARKAVDKPPARQSDSLPADSRVIARSPCPLGHT
ncbi:hypothetical protein [Nibricoccus aquaticus]|uniref:hypothetical protein n=1 Tax=Nibricoccus aquaticus TaxID=2576891 RepID=UPI0010FEE755|nr:hypothetical protein [Nibricoccus aquaticus]